MKKFAFVLLALNFSAFSQQCVVKAVHRIAFNVEQDTNWLWNGDYPENSTFSLYLSADTSVASYFIHQTPTIASKYVFIGKAAEADSALDCLVKSDVGNIYKYVFRPYLGRIIVKHIKILQTNPLETTIDFSSIFIMAEPQKINFGELADKQN